MQLVMVMPLASDARARAMRLAMELETVTVPDDPGVAQKHRWLRKGIRHREVKVSAQSR
jgi:hypothetical protein